ncbi:MAG: type II secretion system protein [Planctomycetota bacterium]|nr:type II secretion system protein [Planctomycetota bacterium]
MIYINIKKHRSNPGFTLIEILVVVAIIAILAGILLAALSGVQNAAKKTQTSTLMQSFGRACDEFALDNGRYPGILPDAVVDGVAVTPMQNALLELMGGARVKHSQSPTAAVEEYDNFAGDATIEFSLTDPITGLNWEIAFDENRFGEGPWLGGRVHEPYFSPKASDLKYKPYDASISDYTLPALIDSWDTPIIYLRSIRKSGPIIDFATSGTLPQFDLPGLDQYFEDAVNMNASLLSLDAPTIDEDMRMGYLTLAIAHPTFWEGDWEGGGVGWGTSRGRYLMISAGEDRTFFEVANEQMHTNQTVNPSNPFSSLEDPWGGQITPEMMDTFNDVIVFGGA